MSAAVLSVFTPTYNCAEFIARSYECLRRQTFDQWEWVVVDDGSDDATASLLADISALDSRVQCYSLDRNRGRGYARNFALEKCSSDQVVVWDVDDVYLPSRLMEIYQAFECGYDYFCSYALVVDRNLNIKGARHFLPSRSKCVPTFVHPTLAFRRSAISGEIYDLEMRAGEDLALMLLLERSFNGFYSEKYLMLYVEDREINLEKTISMHRSHSRTIRRLYDNGVFEYRAIERFLDRYRAFVKWAVLQSLRIWPGLYMLTVRLRYKESVRSDLLGDDHIAVFQEFSNVSI